MLDGLYDFRVSLKNENFNEYDLNEEHALMFTTRKWLFSSLQIRSEYQNRKGKLFLIWRMQITIKNNLNCETCYGLVHKDRTPRNLREHVRFLQSNPIFFHSLKRITIWITIRCRYRHHIHIHLAMLNNVDAKTTNTHIHTILEHPFCMDEQQLPVTMAVNVVRVCVWVCASVRI